MKKILEHIKTLQLQYGDFAITDHQRQLLERLARMRRLMEATDIAWSNPDPKALAQATSRAETELNQLEMELERAFSEAA